MPQRFPIALAYQARSDGGARAFGLENHSAACVLALHPIGSDGCRVHRRQRVGLIKLLLQVVRRRSALAVLPCAGKPCMWLGWKPVL